MNEPIPIKAVYGLTLWEVYARSVALVTVIIIVVAFVMGGRDMAKLLFPEFTLSANLHEKYKTNTAFTDFGAFHKGLSEEEITRRRIANYEKLLRIEQHGALQNLTYVAYGLLGGLVINVVLILSLRIRRRSRV